ncbi:MAG: hypothetical protein GY807_24765 [Gammaproteobacteria bacterium]|nr:hypothetical protein [Gammaproteobacteria bacterium]
MSHSDQQELKTAIEDATARAQFDNTEWSNDTKFRRLMANQRLIMLALKELLP